MDIDEIRAYRVASLARNQAMTAIFRRIEEETRENIVGGSVKNLTITDSPDPPSLMPGQDFIEAFRPRDPLAMIERAAGVPFRRPGSGMPFLRGTEFPTAVWAGEGTTIPLSGASLEPLSIRSKKLGTIIIQTREFLTAAARGDVRQQAQFTAELGRIINQLVAETFLDHTNAGDDATPAGLGYGLPVLPGSADAVDDVAALAESFGGDLTRAVLVMHPMLAVRAGEKFNSMCGARGGDAGGIPVVTSTAAPLTSDGGIIHLIDPSGVAAIEEGFTLDAATSTNLEVPDSNLGYFGLFQTDTIALRAMRFMNWMRALESSVAVMGVNW